MSATHFSHVCCCIDGAGSGTAIAEAVRLAGPDGRVSVVHVTPPEPVVVAALSEWGEVDPADPFATPAMWLDRTVALAGGEPVLLAGDPPAEVACQWARDNGADLMISRARAGGLRTRILGSFAAGLAEQAPCPVLLLGARDGGDRPPAPPMGPYGHVAALTDGSVESLPAIDAARRMAHTDEGRVSVLLFRSLFRPLVERLLGSAKGDGPAQIDRAARDAGGRRPVVLGGRPGKRLERWIETAAPDLLTVVEETSLGTQLRRNAGSLAADGAQSVLVVRPVLADAPAPAPAPPDGAEDPRA